jgi:hypothetical protein
LLISKTVESPPGPTERLTVLARQLLNRIGVITRESIAVERIAGGFSTVYPVLKAMEEAGRVRRGYFIAGRGAAQFADAGALERLRSLREAGGVVVHMLAAADPANPYGATLPWPAFARGPIRLVEEDHLKGMYGRLTGAARTSVARASMLVWCIRSRKIP